MINVASIPLTGSPSIKTVVKSNNMKIIITLKSGINFSMILMLLFVGPTGLEPVTY